MSTPNALRANAETAATVEEEDTTAVTIRDLSPAMQTRIADHCATHLHWMLGSPYLLDGRNLTVSATCAAEIARYCARYINQTDTAIARRAADALATLTCAARDAAKGVEE